MNFWATRLGVTQPPQAPAQPQQPVFQQQAPAPQTPRPWWLSEQYTQAPPTVPAQQQPQQQVPLPVEDPGGWGTVEGSKAKAQSARLTETCPECGSGNYFRPKGMPNALLQCYECGYNPRFSQTGGEGGLPSGDGGPAQPARQLATAGAGGVSQFSPQTIIGRL